MHRIKRAATPIANRTKIHRHCPSPISPDQTMTTKSAVYTHGHAESVLRSHTWRTAANSAAFLLPHLQPTMTLLDVGCGPGTITADLALNYVSQGHVTALENAPSVLDTARAYAAERGAANITFVTGDVHALPFADDTFDVVHAHQVLQHVADPVRALAEMRRVAKPGGIVAVRDVVFGGMIWAPPVHDASMRRWLDTYCRVARGNGGEPDAGRFLHSWARQVGFDADKVECSTGTWCYHSESERKWWGGLWADRTLQSNFATTATKNGWATQEELETVAQTWRDWAADEDGWISLVHGEIIAHV